MKLTEEEVKDLLEKVAAGRNGLYIKEDFINILTIQPRQNDYLLKLFYIYIGVGIQKGGGCEGDQPPN